MTFTQQQIDDLLEDLVALTDTPDLTEQIRRLARFCLLLIEQIDDPEAVRAAIDGARTRSDPAARRPIS